MAHIPVAYILVAKAPANIVVRKTAFRLMMELVELLVLAIGFELLVATTHL